jgi:hypothetical protein
MLGVMCFRLGEVDDVQPWLPFGGFGLATGLVLWWGADVRARRRLKAALDAYAEREMVRERQLPAPHSRAFAPRKRKRPALVRQQR